MLEVFRINSEQEIKVHIQASFDFSEMSIETVGAKDAYINDEPKDFLKVATKGSVTMTLSETTKRIPADGVLILEKEGSAWKITEKFNPWSW